MHRVCVVWFEKDKVIERAFFVPSDDSWHPQVRTLELYAETRCDAGEEVSVYGTSLDGEDTEGTYEWNEEAERYEFDSLDG